ncbi:hypothetical protein VZT92_024042 [Zoarces viviparus]|uniref:Secreted protein n=1 Tax=Zoarces viviparus TaxID=48416 RepID=A0AAW1E0T2_ZOAVI
MLAICLLFSGAMFGYRGYRAAIPTHTDTETHLLGAETQRRPAESLRPPGLKMWTHLLLFLLLLLHSVRTEHRSQVSGSGFLAAKFLIFFSRLLELWPFFITGNDIKNGRKTVRRKTLQSTKLETLHLFHLSPAEPRCSRAA